MSMKIEMKLQRAQWSPGLTLICAYDVPNVFLRPTGKLQITAIPRVPIDRPLIIARHRDA